VRHAPAPRGLTMLHCRTRLVECGCLSLVLLLCVCVGGRKDESGCCGTACKATHLCLGTAFLLSSSSARTRREAGQRGVNGGQESALGNRHNGYVSIAKQEARLSLWSCVSTPYVSGKRDAHARTMVVVLRLCLRTTRSISCDARCPDEILPPLRERIRQVTGVFLVYYLWKCCMRASASFLFQWFCCGEDKLSQGFFCWCNSLDRRKSPLPLLLPSRCPRLLRGPSLDPAIEQSTGGHPKVDLLAMGRRAGPCMRRK